MLEKKKWAIAGGHIPIKSNGEEPECTSYDKICILNAGEHDSHISINIYYSDSEPVGPYHLTVGARRVRHVRINDLIDPQAPPLGVDYGMIIESDVPIIVQFGRQDTSQKSRIFYIATAIPLD